MNEPAATATQSNDRTLLPSVGRFLNSPKQLLIGGKWIAAKSGKTSETINPTNEEVLALVAEGDKADVDEAVKVARKALDEGRWARMGPHERARHLLRIADVIDQHADELAQLETLDNGKPLSQSRSIDVPKAAETFRYYAGWCTKVYGETNLSEWREPYREGIVYYLRAGRVRGVLLWNVWEKVELARALIGGAHTFTSAELDSAIPM